MALRLRAALTAASLLTLAWMAGCSGSGSGDGGGGSASGAKGFLNAYADIYCNGVKPCCDASGEAHDVQSCKLLFQLLGSEAATADHFDQAAANQCLAELQTWIAACENDEPDICERVFSGNQALGQPCNDTVDCQLQPGSEVICDFDFETQSGKCKTVVAPAEGQPCNGGSDTEYIDCSGEPGFYCDYATDICKQRVPIGSNCSSAQCTEDSTCDYTTQLCVAKKAVGESCSPSLDCVDEAYCDTAGICQPKKAAGEACAEFDECLNYCDSDTGTCSGGVTFCVTSN